jgi:hypothetical protein
VPDPATGSLTPELLAGQTLVAGVGRVLADNSLSLIPYLPLTIAQIEAGNTGVAEGFAAAVAPSPDVMHSGLWYSVQWSWRYVFIPSRWRHSWLARRYLPPRC